MDDGILLILTLTIILPLLLAVLLMSWPTQPSHPPRSHLPVPSISLSPPPPPGTFHFSSPADEAHFIARLLSEARSSLTAERPMQALSLVLAAVRQQRGEEGVFDALNAARKGYGLAPHANPVRQERERLEEEQRRLTGDVDVDQLMSSLSLRPAWPSHSLSSTELEGGSAAEELMADAAMEEDGDAASASVLEERGAGHLLDEAMRDREQFATCARCKGVISRSRMQQHRQMWCEADEQHT